MILGRFKLWLLAAAGALMAVLAAWGVGRREGRKAVERDHLKKRLDAAKKAREVHRDVEGLDADGVRKRLDKWVRKSD